MLSHRSLAPALERAALPLILLAALALRVREALRSPLWYDELFTHSAVNRPWNEMMSLMRTDVHPPLHFMLAWMWRFTGDSDLAVRSLSIVLGVAGILAAWALASELFGRRAGLLAAALMTLHPWHLYFSQEARSYPLLWLMLTLSAWGAWRWCEHGRRADAALFVIATALALWTHYLAGVLLMVQWIWGLARLRREPRRALEWIALHAAVAVLFAPVLPLWWEQLHRAEADHWMPRPTSADLFEAFRKLAFSAAYLVPVLIALALAPLMDARRRRAAAFALVAGPGMLLVCWALGTAGVRVFAPKYMMFAIPAFVTLVAAGVVRLPARMASVAAALLVLLALRSALVRPLYPEAGSLGRAHAVLAPLLRPGDIVFHADAHTLLFAQRYFPQARSRLILMGQPLHYYEGGFLISDSVRAEAAELDLARASGARWWAMSARPAGLDIRPASALFDAMAARPPSRFDVVKLWSGENR